MFLSLYFRFRSISQQWLAGFLSCYIHTTFRCCRCAFWFLDSGKCLSKANWKKLVTTSVRYRQHQLWRITCMLYKSLDIMTQSALEAGKASLWWTVSRANAKVAKACRMLVRVLCADHSLNSRRGRFVNHTMLCQMCNMYEIETVTHTLFECPGLEETRQSAWSAFLQQAPPAMREDIMQMTHSDKSAFILSGFRAQYNNDWQPLYETLALFVSRMFNERHSHMVNAV